ncbi:MAG: TPR end-of-group domain-containing protein [Phycisphaerales bacterium JB054]
MLEWIAQNTVVALGLAVLAVAAAVFLPKRPAVAHVCWICVLVALVAPPLPRHGVLDGRSHAVRVVGRAATTVQTLMPREGERRAGRREQSRSSGVAGVAGGGGALGVRGAGVGPRAGTGHGAGHGAVGRIGDLESGAERSEAVGPVRAAGAGGVLAVEDGLRDGAGEGVAPASGARAGREGAGWLSGVDWRRVLAGAVVLVWLAGVVVVSWRTGRVVARVAALVRRGSAASPAFRAFVERVAMDLDVRSPRVRVSCEVTTPFVWGAARPILVWPAGASEGSAGARAVLAHELAHLERRDHWTAWLETVVTCVLWWHPLVYVARRELRRQAEKACDAWVVWAYPKDRRHYADALLDAVERLGVSPLPATALGAVDNDRRSLTRRLLMIMNENVARRGSRALALAAAGLTAVFAPTWAAASRPAVEAMAGVTADIDGSLDALVRRARLEWEAGVYAAGGDSENALRSMGALLSSGPADAGLHSEMGMMLYKAGEYAAAAEHFAAAGELEREDTDHVYNAACCLALAGERDAAMETLARAVALGYADADHAPEDDDLASLRGSAEFRELVTRMGDLEDLWGAAEKAMAKEAWGDAARGFGSAVTLAPECAELQHLLGYCLIMDGELDAAERAFEAALAMGFDEGNCLYNLACVAAKSGRIERAFEMLGGAVEAGFANHELLREDPDLEALHGDSRFREIVRTVTAPMKLRRELDIAIEFGEYESAADKAAALLDMKPKRGWERASAYHQLAMALCAGGDYRGAERAFGEAAKAGHSLEDSLYNIACCRSLGGDSAGAIEYLRAAVEAGYTDAAHMQSDGDLAAVRGEPGFVQVAQLAADRDILEGFAAPSWEYLAERSAGEIEREPGNGMAHLQLGWAQLRTGRTEDALRTFARQAELDFMPGIASYNVACCHAILGDETRAIAAIEKAMEYGFDDVEFMREDPDLANLHGDARFAALLAAHEHDEVDHDHDWDVDDDDWDDDDDDDDDDWDDDDDD